MSSDFDKWYTERTIKEAGLFDDDTGLNYEIAKRAWKAGSMNAILKIREDQNGRTTKRL